MSKQKITSIYEVARSPAQTLTDWAHAVAADDERETLAKRLEAEGNPQLAKHVRETRPD